MGESHTKKMTKTKLESANSKNIDELDENEQDIFYGLSNKLNEIKKPFRIKKPKSGKAKRSIRSILGKKKEGDTFETVPIAYPGDGELHLVPGTEEDKKIYFTIDGRNKLYVVDKANCPTTKFTYWDGKQEKGYVFNGHSPYPIDLKREKLDKDTRKAKREYEESKGLIEMRFTESALNMDDDQVKMLRLVFLVSFVGGFGSCMFLLNVL